MSPIALDKPIFFETNRVYRIYLGGKTYAQIFGVGPLEDTMFPEEWIASRVKAINPKYFGPRDGVSVVRGTDVFFDDLLEEHAAELTGGKRYDCLVKYLDSAIRLPVQVHPSPEFSRRHFNSDYGKTESWLVIATRPGAKIYFGFNRPFSARELSELEERSFEERDVMTSALSFVEPKVGDVYLIPAGLIHAIGAGCTVIEVQEPTDFTIQPENWCGDYRITEWEKYIGLDKATALKCFDYNLYGEKALATATKIPKTIKQSDGCRVESLISYDDTPCFAINRYTLSAGGKMVLPCGPSVWITAEGECVLSAPNYSEKVKTGGYFFLPYAAGSSVTASTENGCVLVECLPGKQ